LERFTLKSRLLISALRSGVMAFARAAGFCGRVFAVIFDGLFRKLNFRLRGPRGVRVKKQMPVAPWIIVLNN
jgi:hypothetical protein